MSEHNDTAYAFHAFPSYTDAEKFADGVIHATGVTIAMGAASWLVIAIVPHVTPKACVTLMIYSLGLIGTLSASAAYNLAPHGRLKERLRRLDHAMIFVMIACTYTPFALNALPAPQGVVLCWMVWFLAAIGVALKLGFPRRCDRVSIALYLGMGWMLLGVMHTAIAVLPETVLLLIVLGGVVYSIGVVVHLLDHVPFHNAAWHALVLVAAGLHFGAVGVQFLTVGAGEALGGPV